LALFLSLQVQCDPSTTEAMQLTDHDLKQINQEYLASLSPGHLLHLSSKLLDDLRDARDRLNQTPQNSLHPSGSYAPWEQVANAERERQADDSIDDAAEDSTEKQVLKPEATQEATRTADNQESAAPANQPGKNKRKRGKQPGAKGVGREVSLAVTGEVIHKTCRQRKVSPWPYIAEVIAARRQGNPAPAIPQASA